MDLQNRIGQDEPREPNITYLGVGGRKYPFRMGLSYGEIIYRPLVDTPFARKDERICAEYMHGLVDKQSYTDSMRI